MITLIRHLTKIGHPGRGYEVLPQPTDTTTGDDLARIKYYRNHIAHLDNATLDSSFFNQAWDDISNVCVSIKQTIKETKTITNLKRSLFN